MCIKRLYYFVLRDLKLSKNVKDALRKRSEYFSCVFKDAKKLRSRELYDVTIVNRAQLGNMPVMPHHRASLSVDDDDDDATLLSLSLSLPPFPRVIGRIFARAIDAAEINSTSGSKTRAANDEDDSLPPAPSSAIKLEISIHCV